MCVVSAVSDYYMNEYWKHINPTAPNRANPVQFDDETKKLLREALERLDKIDKRLDDRECKDEQKEKFLKSIGFEEGWGGLT